MILRRIVGLLVALALSTATACGLKEEAAEPEGPSDEDDGSGGTESFAGGATGMTCALDGESCMQVEDCCPPENNRGEMSCYEGTCKYFHLSR